MSLNCLPGTPCYDAYYHPPGERCYTDSINVIYYGPNLPNTGINTGNNLNLILQKIDNKLSPESLATALVNAIASDPVLAVHFCTLVSNCYTTTTTSTTRATTTTTTTVAPTTTTTTSVAPTTTTTTTTA